MGKCIIFKQCVRPSGSCSVSTKLCGHWWPLIIICLSCYPGLRVGFNESGTVEFTEAGNATLYVTNFDKEYQLENTLDMQIILRRSKWTIVSGW